MSELQKALDYANQNRERFLERFDRSAENPVHFHGCAITTMMFNARPNGWRITSKDLGMENVEVMPTDGGHPVVYGDYIKKPGAPTVLVYGHYDVQPADPLELWETGPFEPASARRPPVRPRLLRYEGTGACHLSARSNQ